ncbi:MAG: hypothetical protein AAFY71_13280 [Bacteroidota bacterium]
MKRSCWVLTLVWILLAGPLFGQLRSSSSLTEVEVDSYKEEAKQLVKFYTFVLNMLGNEDTPPANKQTIIEDSFSKLFRDKKVQIEDDLVGSRSTMTNKDVQAYLKDVDFFYKQVEFDHDILDVQMALRENGDKFFLVEAQRKLKGTFVDGKNNENQITRYFEINLLQNKGEIRIASIYTTGEALKPELTSWWNELSNSWKGIFAADLYVNDSLSLADLKIEEDYPNIGDTVFFLDNSIIVIDDEVTRDLLHYKNIEGEVGDTVVLQNETAILLETPRLKADLKHLLKANTMDLQGVIEARDVTPLALFEDLEVLNLSNSGVRDLFPLRQLKNLRKLDLSFTATMSLEPLKYLNKLDTLILRGASIQSIKGLESLSGLSYLDLSSTPLEDLKPVSGMLGLKTLLLEDMEIQSLEPIESLNGLEEISVKKSFVASIRSLSGQSQLRYLNIERTHATNLEVIANLKKLKHLFASHSDLNTLSYIEQLDELEFLDINTCPIEDEEVNQFIYSHPDVRVLYKTDELVKWWESITPSLKKAFLVNVSKPQEFNDNLEDNLVNLTNRQSLSLVGVKEIKNLDFLPNFPLLHTLSLSNSGMESLVGINHLPELKILVVNNCPIQDFSPLNNCKRLQTLIANGTQVGDLSPLSSLKELEIVSLNNTSVRSLTSLVSLAKLKEIQVDDSGLSLDSARAFVEKRPKVDLIFRSEKLRRWWGNLNPSWREGLSKFIKGSPRDIKSLHKLTSLRKLELSSRLRLSDLQALEPFFVLEELYASGLNVRSLDGLQSLRTIKKLDISKNPFEDLTAVENLPLLEKLNISNTAVKSLLPLQNSRNIQEFNCSGTQLKSLEGLENMRNMEFLDCSSTPIKSLLPVLNLFYLKSFNCSNTRLTEKKVNKFRENHPLCDVTFY